MHILQSEGPVQSCIPLAYHLAGLDTIVFHGQGFIVRVIVRVILLVLVILLRVHGYQLRHVRHADLITVLPTGKPGFSF